MRRLGLLRGRLGLRESRRSGLLCRRRFRTRGRRLALLRRATSGLPRSTGSAFRTAARGSIGFFRRLLLLRHQGVAHLERGGDARRREQRNGNERAPKQQCPCRLLLSHGHPQSARLKIGQTQVAAWRSKMTEL